MKFSLKADGIWRGMTTQTLADSGDRRFHLLENCYVSSDGSEIRTMPGWKTVYDFETYRRSQLPTGSGYYKNAVDKATPVATTSGNYFQWLLPGSHTNQQLAWSEPKHLFGFKRVRGRLIVFGEDDFRREPISNDVAGARGNSYVKIASWAPNGSGKTVLTLDLAPYAPSVYPDIVYGSVWPEAIIWIEDNASVHVDLRAKMHRVLAISGSTITLDTTSAATGSAVAQIAVVKYGWGYGGQSLPMTQHSSIASGDFYSLIAYQSLDRPTIGTVHTDCHPAYVFNRMPDSGDGPSANDFTEGSAISIDAVVIAAPAPTNTSFSTNSLPAHDNGKFNTYLVMCPAKQSYTRIITSAYTAGQTDFTTEPWSGAFAVNTDTVRIFALPTSRRRQQRLPWRPNPDATNDRLLLGAPEYGCVFQVPIVIPNDPTVGNEVNGAKFRSNDVLDKPRCLGVPKAVMWCDAKLVGTPGATLNAHTYNATTDYQFPAGTYTFAVAYRDDATGEIGPLSETITLTSELGVTVFSDAGAGTVYTATTLTDGGSAWVTDTHVGRKVVAGGSTGRITANTATQITVASWSAGTPPNGTAYDIIGMDTGFHLYPMHPGYLMAESGALTILVYRTEVNDTDGILYLDAIPTVAAFTYPRVLPLPFAVSSEYGFKYGLNPATALTAAADDLGNPYWKLAQLDLRHIDDMVLAEREPAGIIEQMPAGAGCVRTTRGITLFANRIGNAGFINEMQRGTFTSEFRAGSTPPLLYTDPEQVTVRNAFLTKYSATFTEGLWGLSNPGFPPGLAGIEPTLFSDEAFPMPRHMVRLDDIINNFAELPNVAGTEGVQDYIRWRVLDSTIDKESSWTTFQGKTGYLQIPRSRYQWSIKGNPAQVPAVNTGYADAEADEEIEGIGTFGSGFLLATRSNTYLLSFTEEPRTTPDIVSNEFGCIAPNTFVEFDGGTAWISSRGPVAMTGEGMTWIGRDIEAAFTGSTARYKRDSQGRMRHAWGCHDADRGLVIFGLLADKQEEPISVVDQGETLNWTTATDKIRSRFPCDELLVWSYRANSWSRWRMPPGLEVLWMERDIDSNGIGRLLFLAADKRIYAMDDNFADTNVVPVVVTATGSGTGAGPITVSGPSMGSDVTNRANDSFVRTNMVVMHTRNNQLVTLTNIASFTSNSITLDQSVTWAVGDRFVIGCRISTIESNFIRSFAENKRIGKFTARYSLSSDGPDEDSITDPTIEFIRAEIVAGRRHFDPDGQAAIIRRDAAYVNETRGYIYKALGVSASEQDTAVHDLDLANGSNVGESMAIRATVVGAARVRFSDMIVEAT